jgi:hypothetical protein
VVPKVTARNICTTHPRNEMTFFFDIKSISILGVITAEKQASENDRKLRKQYIGLWSLESPMNNTITPTFPMTVKR